MYRRRLIVNIQKLEEAINKKQYPFKSHDTELIEVVKYGKYKTILDRFENLISHPINSTILYRCRHGRASAIALHKKEAMGLSGKTIPVLSVRRIRGSSQVIRDAVMALLIIAED